MSKCPNCRLIVQETELLIIDRELDDIKYNFFDQEEKRSSKIEAVVEEVVKIKEKGEKCLIFT